MILPPRSTAILLIGLASLSACGPQGSEVREDARIATPRPTLNLSAARATVEESVQQGRVTATPELTLAISPVVARVYRDERYRTLWLDTHGLSERGAALLDSLRNGRREGLPWRAHGGAVVDALLGTGGNSGTASPTDIGAWARVDVALTEAFFRYATTLAQGALDLSTDLEWQLPRDAGPDGRFLLRAAAGEDPHVLLDELRPALPYYERMQRALAHYREIQDAGGWGVLETPGTLEEGMSGRAVGALRDRLIAEGDPVERTLALEGQDTPNRFDGFLARAVEHYQRRHALEPDGVVGGKTVETLNVPVQERVNELLLNLDRLRWLPRDLGPLSILVNVAGFELEVLEFHEPVLSMSVVVGRPEWSTTLFADTMEYVVLNPYWYVPPSIQDEETLPGIRGDPEYLERNEFDVLTRRGEDVVLDSIQWDSVSAGQFVFRQRPGPGNSLGRVKFMFPNQHNIYLHDTPAHNLFSRASRAFSHGCIRVEDPPGLARYLFRMATDRSPEEVAEILATGEETTVPLARPVPVYLTYMTSWVDPDGAVFFHPDIYDRNTGLMPSVEGDLGLNAVLLTL